MVSSFTVETASSHSAADLFDLSLSIDAHVASMAHTTEQAVAGVTSGSIGDGETVTWRARHFGIMWKMTSLVSEVDRPHRFVDAQVRGPFQTFHHVHTFTEVPGGSIMRDVISVESPVFGALAERLVLVPYLRRLITKRNAFLVATLDARR